MRRLPALAVIAILTVAACGGSDDDTAATTPDTEPVVADEPDPTTAPAPTDPPATDTPATDPPATDPPATDPPATDAPATDDPAAGTIDVSLVEFAIETETTLPAGPITFAITNDGDFPHHLSIARGTSYEVLPQLGNGAVDEAALGDDFLGGTENIPSGGADTIDFDLEPGDYVLFCNIVAGPNSHAARGQVLSVVVEE